MRLNLNCPINTTSYGYVSSFFMKELSNKCDLRHIPIYQNSPDDELLPHLKPYLDRWDFHHDAACLRIWHQHELTTFYGHGPSIGFPIFELEGFSSQEEHSLLYPDHIFVCSKWAKNVIESKLNRDNVYVTPLGYDDTIFIPEYSEKRDTTVFGNFGKFEIRKGHDVLIKAFNYAFEKTDDVLLVMMPTNIFLTREEAESWTNRYKKSKLGDKIQIIPRVKTQRMVYSIMSQIDCGVFPARAEGWNLEALECLACGKHLIITDCTGHTEFANEQNSKLIKMTSGFEKAIDNKFFNGSSEWRSFGDDEMEQLVYYLRKIHEKNTEGLLTTNTVGAEQAKEFSWKNSGNKLFKTIKEITGE